MIQWQKELEIRLSNNLNAQQEYNMWNNILKITIDHTKVASNLTDFPVYVNLADLGASFFTDVKTDGSDIRVFDSSTGLEVPYELVAIDTVLNTGQLYFKGNLSSTIDTSFYIKYGNASASAYADGATYGKHNVWTDYDAVYHLNENGSTKSDSTANNLDGTVTGTVTSVAGQVGNASRFDADIGSKVFVSDAGGITNYNRTDNYTIQFWARRWDLTTVSDNSISEHWEQGAGIDPYPWALRGFTNSSDVAFHIYNGGSGAPSGQNNNQAVSTGTTGITDGQFNQYSFVKDYASGLIRAYSNGVERATTSISTFPASDTTASSANGFCIGARQFSDSDKTPNGDIQEFRLRKQVLSQNWFTTEYNNQSSSSTFYSISPVSVLIDGIDKSSLIDWKSVRREQVLTKESDKLSFLLRKHNGQTYKPTVGDEVILTINATKEFGGYIVELQEDVEGRVEYIKCICKDYTHELDRQLVSKTYEAMTVNAIIADLTTTFATGITDNNVNCTTLIDSVTFNYLPISQCLQRLTDIVEGYDWYIDYNKDVHFFFSESVASTFDLTDTSGNYVYNSLALRQDTHQLRNEVIVRGGLLTSTTLRTEFLSGDGTKTVFPLATKFANLPTVAISSVNKTVGVENIDGAGFDCYWNYNEKSLKFTVAPANGTSNITVIQYPQYPLILQKRSESSVTSYGLFQSVIVDKNIRDLETAGLRADVELLKYSEPEKTADFLTYTSGLMTGQTINVNSTIRGINQDYKIQSIRSSLKTPNTDELVHEVSCITAEDLGINDILARLLIKNPSDQIQIQADEFVERIRQLSESFTIIDNTPTATEVIGPFLYGTAIMGFSTWA
jgi:hypothetical protein